ncbi:PP2C family serine/threonine-protein phosphatase [Sphingomonas sp.]|jgi:serine/threonine protein phosphatase PrpC|uniref:PP2C family serine/threonine-protein phosphatase n=1 Tax=Sphingomonas sp. TaxID=28214 RepID=UPI002DF5AF68|nr:PP2C family serine/threonine-protein phosphatase [Sphingomonas sp.]
MSGYEPSRLARSAVETLLHAIEKEAVPETHLFQEDGMNPAYQRALAVLRACAAKSPGGEGEPAASKPVPNADPVNAEPEVIMSRFGSGPQEVKPFDLTAQHGTFTPPPPPAAEVAPPASDEPQPQVQAEAPVLRKDSEPAEPVAQPAPASLLTIKKTVALKNARAGESYTDRLTVEGARDVRLVNAGRSGLSFDEATSIFSGTPGEAGDHEISLKGKIDGRPAEITATLIVVADPKSLWTSLPSDATDRFHKPDEAFSSLTGPALRMIGASKRGRSHAKTGGFREDDFAFAVHGDWHIAAVADGAGSAAYSRRGSKLAVETVTAELPALIDQQLGEDFEPLLDQEAAGGIKDRLYRTLVAASFDAAETLIAQAEQLNESASKLSTTLIVVIARRFGTRWFVGSFSIGDGGAGLLDLEAKTVQPLTSPDAGEYAGQTRFLAKSEFLDNVEVMKRVHYAVADRFTALALMSDGITDPKLPTDKVFADPAAWASLWNDDLCKQVDFSAPEAEIEKQFLAWLDFWSPGNHDDRTLAVLLPRES